MLKRFSFIFLFIFSLLEISAQKTTCRIFGTAPSYEGNVIGAYMYDDYVTATEKKLGETIVSDSGTFSMEVELTEVTYVYLKSKNVKGFLYAEPGRAVELEFPQLDTKNAVNPNVDYTLPTSVYISDSTDMNFLADDYISKFDKFWGYNRIQFIDKDSVGVLNTFHNDMDKEYAWVKNPYFKPWMDYGLASMEDGIGHSQLQSGKRYIVGKKIYYHNSEYMEFFNNFFKDYMYKWSSRKEGEGMVAAINQFANYDTLMYAMKRLPWLENDSMRELVMLKGLFDSYTNPAFNPKSILSICYQASTRSKISEDRHIARNIIAFFSKLKVGTMAPHFYAKNKLGKEIDPLALDSGHYIYLFFFATWNEHAMSEFRYMAELQKKYGKKITFVSISVDPDTNAYKAFLKANPKYNWLILHYNFLEKTKTDYNLYDVPAGFIIAPDGKLYVSPTDNPSGDLEYNLYRIANPKDPAWIKPGDR